MASAAPSWRCWQDEANSHRKVLEGYTLPLLDQLMTIVTSGAIMTYSLYTFSAPNLPENHVMMLTIPFVLFGVFRYLHLVQVEQCGGAPEEVLFFDRPLQVDLLAWGLSIVLIFYLLYLDLLRLRPRQDHPVRRTCRGLRSPGCRRAGDAGECQGHGHPGEDSRSDGVVIQAPDIGLQASLAELPANHPLKAAIRRTAKALNIPKLPPCTLRIKSTIPVAAGLGSGAAVTVAIARALSAASGQPPGRLPRSAPWPLKWRRSTTAHPPASITPSSPTPDRSISSKVSPSQQLQVGRAFTIVIGDTGIASPTAKAVGDVRTAWHADQRSLRGAVRTRSGALADSARQAIEQGAVELLGPLMDANHGLLRKLGVSCPELDALVLAARKAGAWGAKLSGGGRGGNMIALVNKEQAQRVAAALQSAGAVRTLVTEIKNSKD